MGQIRHEIDSLTGVRGVAACWVVAYHGHEFGPMRGTAGVLLRHGYLAVDLFFVLSGFVMALSYARLFAPDPFAPRAYVAFLLRRIARVYPLYLVLTLFCAGLAALEARAHGGSIVALFAPLGANLLLIESWGLSWPIDGPAWSISTEAAAYVLFPILLMLLVFGRRAVAAVAIAVAASVVLLAVAQTAPASYPYPRQGPLDIAWPYSPWPVLRCVAEFSFGLAAWRIGHGLPWLHRRPGLATAVAALLFALLLRPGTDLAILFLLPVLVIGLLAARDPVSRLLASTSAHALGRWSYAIYLWHFVLLDHLRPRLVALAAHLHAGALAPMVVEAAFWTALLALAATSYALIERPGQNAIRAVERRLFAREDGRIGAVVVP